MSLKLFLYSALLSTLVAQVYATSCECKEVTSWEDFRSLIVKANENGSQSPENLLLCPFHIKKIIQKDVDYWEVFAPIKKPMHISCQKQSSSDECWIEVEGDKCQFNENCGRQMIKIRSSDVTIEGFKITSAKDNVISTDKDLDNIRLIDLSMYRNSVPGSNEFSNGIISVNSKTSMQILNSDFSWNKGIVVENRGHLMIHSSSFSNNRIKTQGVTGGAVTNQYAADVVITSSSFTNTKLGPGILTSYPGQIIDGGLNCASGNDRCDGVEREGAADTSCVPLLGGACVSTVA